MIKRICNRCGQLYDSDLGSCNCNATKKAIAENRKRYDKTKRDTWYNNKGWRATSRFIRTRDYNTDRLQMFLSYTNKYSSELKLSDKSFLKRVSNEGWYKLLTDDLIREDGTVMGHGGLLLVHHIIPREEDKNRWYDLDNLITLFSSTHELVHYLYNTKDKQKVQELLFLAVSTEL